jgi:hypothetical protein
METQNTLPVAVLAISQIHFEGDIIPQEWFKHIKTSSGETDAIGILILADLISWYRPIRAQNENTGEPLPPRQKFEEDMFRATETYYQNKFGFNKDQIEQALTRLEKTGYIRQEISDFKTKVSITQIRYIEPIPSKILEITYPNNIGIDKFSFQNDQMTRTVAIEKTAEETAETCSYCLGSGQITFIRPDGTLTQVDCKHGKLARDYIRSIKKNYGYDYAGGMEAMPTPEKLKNMIKNCPYCNKNGMLDLRNRHSGKFDIRPCSHDPEKIKQLALNKNAKIASAKPGYDDPMEKKKGTEAKSTAWNDEIKADDDEVPF